MKRSTKKVLVALCVLGIVVTLFAATEEYDYGKVRWGMTIIEVVRAIGKGGELDFLDWLDGGFLLEVDSKCGIYCAETYSFDNKKGQLESVTGRLADDVTEKEAFLFLSKTYGKPVATNTTPKTKEIVFIRGRTRATLDFDDKFGLRYISYYKYTK